VVTEYPERSFDSNIKISLVYLHRAFVSNINNNISYTLHLVLCKNENQQMSASNDEGSVSGSDMPAPVSSTSSLDSFQNTMIADQSLSMSMSTTEVDTPTTSLPQTSAAFVSSLGQPTRVIPSPVITQPFPPGRQTPDMHHSFTMGTPLLTSSVLLAGSPQAGGSVPEFLYQLTKMLTDDNRDIIEWSDGRSFRRESNEEIILINANPISR